MRVARLCVVLLIGTATSAIGQSVVPRGNPFPISVQAGFDAAGGRPGIAGAGDQFLTVWRDARNASTHADDPYAARVTHDGAVLDPQGIRLSQSTADAEWPSVAFDGTYYLVVWVEPVAPNQFEVFGSIVATDGTVVARDVPITTSGFTKQRVVSIAHDGTNFLVVWRTFSDRIRATRVSRTGAVLASLDGPGGFAVASTGGDFYPWVTYGSGQFLVAWHGWGIGLDIFAARVTTAGVVLDPEGFVVSDVPGVKDHVSVAASGSNYLITFRNQLNEDSYRNAMGYAVRVSPAGTVLDTTPRLIAADVHWGSMMPVVFDGTNYFAMWQVHVPAKNRYVDLMGRRIAPDGTLLDPSPLPIATSYNTQGWLPMFAYANDRFLAAWTDMGREAICQPACIGGQILEKLSAGGDSAATDPASAESPTANSNPWSAVASPTTVVLNSVQGLDDGTAVASRENTQLIRYDGSAWSVWSSSFTGTDYALWANAPNDVWAAGWSWGIKRYNGSSWTYTDLNAQRGLSPVAMGAWSSGATSGMVVGVAGRAIRFDGAAWQSTPTGVGVDLWDVWGASPTSMFAVGERGTILQWNGSVWSQAAGLGTLNSLNGVWGTSETNVFAVGDFGTILHFDGVSWTGQASGTTEHLMAIAGVSPTQIYAVGFRGTILQFDGSTWQADSSGTTATLLDVAVAGDTIWAVGDGGTIRRKAVDTAHCARSLSQTNVAVDAAGGQRSVTLTTNCTWKAWSNATWIALTSSSNGTGDTTTTLAVQPNTLTTPRIGTATVAGMTVTITQAGANPTCTFTISPTSATPGPLAGNGGIDVTASSQACTWTASSNAGWLTVTAGSGGTGNGTVGYAVAANTATSARTGTLTVAGLMFTVLQSGTTPTCSFLISPTGVTLGAAGANGTVTVLATGDSCGWFATSSASWLTVTSGSTGTGNGAVGYAVSANMATTPRSGALTIAGHAFTVMQAGAVTPILLAPTDVVASVSGNTVTTAWRVPGGGLPPTGFVLEGGTAAGSVQASIPTGSTSPAFSFSAPTGVFYIRLHAVAGTARSAASNEVRIAVNVPMPPAPPADLAGEAFGSHLRLAWQNRWNEGVPSSSVLEVSGAISAALPLALAESFTFSGVPPGTYAFAVRNVNGSGPGATSNPVTLTFPAACVAAGTPADFAVAQTGNAIAVSWARPVGGPTPSGYSVNVTGSFNGSFPVAGLSLSGTAGTGSYTINVVALHPCGASAPTAPRTVQVR